MIKKGIKATNLRNIIISIILIVTILVIGGFYFTQEWLKNFTQEVVTIDNSSKIKHSVHDLNELKFNVTRMQETNNKAISVFMTGNDIKNQITSAINNYAVYNNINITNYSQIQTDTHNNIQTNSITVTLANPIPFNNLMIFMKMIENNIPKMQIDGINATRSQTSNSSVVVEPFTIKVYIK